MVVDRKKVKSSSEFKRYQIAGRFKVRAGRKVVQSQAGVKTGKTVIKRIAKGVREKHAG